MSSTSWWSRWATEGRVPRENIAWWSRTHGDTQQLLHTAHSFVLTLALATHMHSCKVKQQNLQSSTCKNITAFYATIDAAP